MVILVVEEIMYIPGFFGIHIDSIYNEVTVSGGYLHNLLANH
jgi:hypothetical protein